MGANTPVFGYFSQKRIGLADFIFRKGQTVYVAELKYSDQDSVDIWESLKAIGYAKAYTLQTGKKAKPVVILRKELINNDIRPIFYGIGVGIIEISRDKEGFLFEYDFG